MRDTGQVHSQQNNTGLHDEFSKIWSVLKVWRCHFQGNFFKQEGGHVIHNFSVKFQKNDVICVLISQIFLKISQFLTHILTESDV